MTDATKIEKYGSLEKAEEVRINNMLETKQNWTDEQKKELSEKMKLIQKIFSMTNEKYHKVIVPLRAKFENERSQMRFIVYVCWIISLPSAASGANPCR